MRGWAFFQPLGLGLLLCAVACAPPRSPGTRPGYSPSELIGQEWEEVRRLPEAAQAMRDVGVDEADIVRILDVADRELIEAADLVPAMEAIVEAQELNGPVGDLGDWVTARLQRYAVRGDVLVRSIHAHYTAYGYYNLRLPDRQAPTFRPPGADEPPLPTPLPPPPPQRPPQTPGATP